MINNGFQKRWIAAERAVARLDEAAKDKSVGAWYVADAVRREAAASLALEGDVASVEQVAWAVISPTSYARENPGAARACHIRTALLEAAAAQDLESQWIERVVRANISAIEAPIQIEGGIVADKVLREVQRLRSCVEGHGIRGLAWMFRELERSELLADAVPGSRPFDPRYDRDRTLTRVIVDRPKRIPPLLARTLTPWMARSLGITERPVLFVSSAIKKAGSYSSYLREGGEAWETWFMDMVTVAAQHSLQRLHMLEPIKVELRGRLKPYRKTRTKYVDRLFHQPVVTARWLAKDLGLTTRGTRKLLDDLVESRVVQEITGNGSFRVYAARDLTTGAPL